MKNFEKSVRWMLVIILIILMGLTSTFLLRFPQTEKQIIFSLLDKGTLVEDIPDDLPLFLFEKNVQLELLHPSKIWLAEEGSVKLNISLADSGLEQSEKNPGSYTYYYEVRLNLDSIELLSGDTIFEPIRLGNNAIFNWRIVPLRSGSLNGNIWVYVHITDSAASGHWQVTRFALPVRIQVIDFLRLSLQNLRTLLFLGILILLLLTLAFYLSGYFRKKPG